MYRAVSFSLLMVLTIAAVPWPAGATPNHPDVAVRLQMERFGSDVNLRADLDNEGARAAKNVRLHLTLPEGRWALGAGGDACNGAGERKVCRLQELGAGDRWTLTAVLHDAPCQSLAAAARVHTPSDKESSNDQARASVDSTCGPADVGVQKFGARTLTTITFTLVVTNQGPRAARSVVLIDDLPQVGFPWIVHGPDAEACRLRDLRLECRWDELPTFESRMVQVSAEASPCQTVTNTARVHSSDDPDRSNNASTARVEALCEAEAVPVALPIQDVG